MPLGYGVIGSPTGSGPVSLGSSPGTPASSADSADTLWCPRLFISALRLGRDIRVGVEDAAVPENGRLARGDRELVQAAARLADEV